MRVTWFAIMMMFVVPACRNAEDKPQPGAEKGPHPGPRAVKRDFEVPNSSEPYRLDSEALGHQIIPLQAAYPFLFQGLVFSPYLLPYRHAEIPACRREAVARRKIMRKARSKKRRPLLLASLEARYKNSS